MSKITKASGNDVEPYWPMLFSKALKGQDIGSLLANIGSAGGAGGAAPSGDVAVVEAKADEPEEKKKEDEPEDVDMGGLFGDDDDY